MTLSVMQTLYGIVTVKNQPGDEALGLQDNVRMFNYSRPASTLRSYLLASEATCAVV